MRRLFPFLCLLMVASARAVIVSGGDGSGNLTGTGVSGWDYVGTVNGASGVYLGNYDGSYWVLTAGHVGAGNFTLNGTTYSVVAGSSKSLTNDDGTVPDLKLFRIESDPGLPTLALSDSRPAAGTSVTMIGYGINRAPSITQWDTNWSESPFGFYSGYKLTGTHAKRWGGNTVVGPATNGATDYFTTTFLSTNGSAQATVGDSGGGVFITVNGTLELAGSMGLVATFDKQPKDTSVYGNTIFNNGNQTYSADIAVYRAQILGIVSAVPEPGVSILGFGGLLIILAGGMIRTRRAALR